MTHDLQLPGADIDLIAWHQRPTAAPLGDTIDTNPPRLHQRFRLAPGLHDAGPFQKSAQLDAGCRNHNALCSHRCVQAELRGS